MNFFNDYSQEKYDLLVKFYEEYIKSCTLQPMIFPQASFKDEDIDVINSEFIKYKEIYISQYSRLIDSIRLGNIRDQNNIEINITSAQEFYLRFTLASWIMSKLNSYNDLGKQIRKAISRGYTQLIYIIELKVIYTGRWFAKGEVLLYRDNEDSITYSFNDTLLIDEEEFYSPNPFAIHSNFCNTPIEILNELHQLTYILIFCTYPVIDYQNYPLRSRIYAEFWLKKMIANIIMVSEEWKTLIHSYTNIEKIDNIRYYLWNESLFVKKIQFKFDIKLVNQDNWLFLDYEYTIKNPRVFGGKNISKLENFVLWNHNLQD